MSESKLRSILVKNKTQRDSESRHSVTFGDLPVQVAKNTKLPLKKGKRGILPDTPVKKTVSLPCAIDVKTYSDKRGSFFCVSGKQQPITPKPVVSVNEFTFQQQNKLPSASKPVLKSQRHVYNVNQTRSSNLEKQSHPLSVYSESKGIY